MTRGPTTRWQRRAAPGAACRARHAHRPAARDRRLALLRGSQRERGGRSARRLGRTVKSTASRASRNCASSPGSSPCSFLCRRHNELRSICRNRRDIVRALLNRCTDDLHAPAAVTRASSAGTAAGAANRALARCDRRRGRDGIRRRRVRARRRAAPGSRRSPAPPRALRLTAAQHGVVRAELAAAAASRPRPLCRDDREAGRLHKPASSQPHRRHLDLPTGPGPAELPVDRHGSPTEAAFDAMPTDPSALRALLLAQARQQQAQAQALEQRILAEHEERSLPRRGAGPDR